jgi:hypothetical protein
MKKIVALFMVCAMALSLTASAKGSSAKMYFSRGQFQPSHKNATKFNGFPALTFPLVYTGSVKFTGWIVNCEEKNCVVDEKITPDLIMTICQPCIDCFTCVVVPAEATGEPETIEEPVEGPQSITAWNLYAIVNYKFGKTKYTYIRKINLIAAGAVFFTGAAGTKPGVIQYLSEDGKAMMLLGGKKSDYTFTYYQTTFGGTADDGSWDGSLSWDDTTTANSSTKGYIKSFAELKGSLNLADPISEDDCAGYQLNGDVSLKRDAKLTGMAVKAIFTTSAKAVKNWEDCGGDAGYCEQYFISGDEDYFDEYLVDKYKKTLDDSSIELVDAIDDLYEGIYLAIYDKELVTEASGDDEGGEGGDDQP